MIAEIVLMAALTVISPEDPQPPGGVPDPGTAGGEVVEIIPEEDGEEGDLIVLPDDDDTSSPDDSLPGDGSGDDGEVIEDEFVPDSTGDTVVIISPDDLAAILQSADSISLLADYGSSDNSLPSGTFLTYAQGLADRVPWGQHYVCWRDDGSYNSTQYFAYGNLSEDGGQFEGSVQVCEYYYVSSQSGYRLSWSIDSNFSLDGSNGFVYSDLGNFPALNGGETFEEAALFLLGFDIVLGLVLSILLGRYTRY